MIDRLPFAFMELINFKPLPFLTSGRWQTILGSFGIAIKPPPSRRVDVTLPDGDILVCKISEPKVKPKGVVMMLHGLGGSENSLYMVRISRKLVEKGYVAVRVNHRGCGPGEGLARLPHYAGGSKDVISVVEMIQREFGDLPLHIAGFSLGAHILLKYLGECGENYPKNLVNTIAICPSVEPADTVRIFGLKKNRLFEKYYLEELVRLVRLTEQAFPELKRTDFPNDLSIYLFDELYVAPSWGFKSADEYYDLCRASRFIPNIKVPCRILNSMDDPLVNYKLIENIKLPPSVFPYVTAYGGHMGYLGFTGNGWDIRWMDDQVIKWVLFPL